MKSIMSIDVEDWFHILDVKNAPEMSKWDLQSSLVEKNFYKLIDVFNQKDIKTTCFFLGWVAKKFPHLVKEAYNQGHEIASHGFSHKLVYNMSSSAFREDITKAKYILEDIISDEVKGYRSPGFSNTEDTPWFFEELINAGYKYDSSEFPKKRHHGGIETNKYAPYKITDDFLEFPITLVEDKKHYKCFFGGGYLRHTRYNKILKMSKKVLEEDRPVIFYIHPREIDPKHPKIAMGIVRYIKSYGGLKSTEKKLQKITQDFELTTFKSFIEESDYKWN